MVEKKMLCTQKKKGVAMAVLCWVFIVCVFCFGCFFFQVCTSSYYLLSDLYLPDSCIHNRWVDESQDDTSEQVQQFLFPINYLLFSLHSHDIFCHVKK